MDEPQFHEPTPADPREVLSVGLALGSLCAAGILLRRRLEPERPRAAPATSALGTPVPSGSPARP